MHTPSLRPGVHSRAAAALTPIEIQRMEAERGDEQMMQLIPDQSYLQERADQMSQVEENIVELGRSCIRVLMHGYFECNITIALS